MTLDLTGDEADRLNADGRVVLFRVGECIHIPHHDNPSQCESLPPAEFVEAAKLCETCGGRGGWQPDMEPAEPCEPCDGYGQRRIAAVAPCDLRRRCPICYGLSSVIGRHAWGGYVTEQPCPRCHGKGDVPCEHVDPEFPVGLVLGPCDCDDGLVTVAIVVVESGPAIVSRSHVEGALHIVEMQTHDGPQWFICDCDEMCEPFDPPDVDPATLVGQYALGIRKVDQ